MVQMIDRATISDPKTHYGSGKAATRDFFVQRLTGALNVLFTIFFVWFVVRLAGGDRAAMVDVVRNPVVGIVLSLLIINVCVHMRIGMNEVLEDYVVDHGLNVLLRRLNTLFAIAVAAVTVLSIAKIVFWG
ncbi:MAG: succinate dehydrogenase, hydrophobic membrane anchor protein [Devosia sp.]